MKDQRNRDNRNKERLEALGSPEMDPYEIAFREEFLENGHHTRQAFVNEHGVIIGDHEYQSANSPLEQWTKDTDPAIMSGDGWVHPFKDIGFHADENKAYFEDGVPLSNGRLAHPNQDAAHDMIFQDKPDKKNRKKRHHSRPQEP
ncbi:DUF3905 domain-containing protein [Marinicrinis sediminis]|uniref:DUF3905 domain-containing protein n=1 Tax=Marinicrinis sediminis TaxID=1652465 RepID=A0ABW5RGC7_9BACL